MKALKAIYAHLIADATVNSLTGGRVFVADAPQTTPTPYVIFRAVSVNPATNKTGPSPVDNIRVQVDTFGKGFAEVADIDEAVRVRLDKAPTFTESGETIDGIKYENTTQGISEDPEYYQITTDYIIRHLRP